MQHDVSLSSMLLITVIEVPKLLKRLIYFFEIHIVLKDDTVFIEELNQTVIH